MADPGVVGRALARMTDGEHLDSTTARELMNHIMEGAATSAQIAAILIALRLNGESAEEIHGMAASLAEHATQVELPLDAVDTCGTGGDGRGTFNISTAAALVVAGAGCPVAKHGNRAASSRCGSADVLEALGVAVALPPAGVTRCVVEAGIGFLFAPAFHPAMRHVAAVRSELGVRTIFNVLGPLANPAGVRHQLVGTGNQSLAPVLAEALRGLGRRHALVISGPGGLDEIGLDGPTHGYDVTPERVVAVTIQPATLGLASASIDELSGGDATENARQIREVLAGSSGPRRDVVLVNAAAALVAADRVTTIEEGLELARHSIDSGEASRRIEALIAISQEEAA